ncbi:hypothetical protein [Lewinella cohaerens]|nr:hypothetical protein [Lewinella cohaerens]
MLIWLYTYLKADGTSSYFATGVVANLDFRHFAESRKRTRGRWHRHFE